MTFKQRLQSMLSDARRISKSAKWLETRCRNQGRAAALKAVLGIIEKREREIEERVKAL